jgi:hypothetical protein
VLANDAFISADSSERYKKDSAHLPTHKASCANTSPKLTDCTNDSLSWRFCRLCNVLKRVRQQCIPCQDGHFISIHFVICGLASSHVVIVLHRRTVSLCQHVRKSIHQSKLSFVCV